MDRFNRTLGRVVRVEVDIPGFDLDRSTQAYRKRLSQSKRAQNDASRPTQLEPETAPRTAHPPSPKPQHARPDSATPSQGAVDIDMDAEMVVFGDKQVALATAAAKLAPFSMEL